MERKIPQKNEEEESVQGPTFNLFLVNLVFYVFSILIGGSLVLIGDPALVLFGFSYYSLSLGLLWTPITSMFTHSGIAHLGGNMIFLFIYGFKLEERGYSGQGIYIAYIVTGLLASLLSAPLIGYRTISVGASGAVFGLLGVNAGIERRAKDPNFKRVIYASVILFILASGPRTNVFAHLVGLVIGIIIGNSGFFSQYKTNE